MYTMSPPQQVMDTEAAAIFEGDNDYLVVLVNVYLYPSKPKSKRNLFLMSYAYHTVGIR